MREDIAFEDAWNLQGYRRTTEGPDIYVVVTKTGTVVDIHGYLPANAGSCVAAVPLRF